MAKVKVFSSKRPNTTYLQGFGWVVGTPAIELKEGNTMVWNNGGTSTVGKTLKETPKQITIEEIYISSGQTVTGQRTLAKNRIVARPADELPNS